MGALFFAMVGLERLGEVLLYIGLALALVATVLYLRDGIAQLRAPSPCHESQAQPDSLGYTSAQPGLGAGVAAIRFRGRPAQARERREPTMDTFPDLGSLTDAELKDLIQRAHRGGDRDLLPAADPARQDRHPARRARQPPAQEARGRRSDDHRRRRPAADGHPRRAAEHARSVGRRSPDAERPGSRADGSCTARSAASSTAREPTTASAAARCSRAGAEARTGGDPPPRPIGSARPASWCRSRSARSQRRARRS